MIVKRDGSLSPTKLDALRLAVLILLSCVTTATLSEEVKFNRDIRPLLSDNCFACHGQDANKRKADLDLTAAKMRSSPARSSRETPSPAS